MDHIYPPHRTIEEELNEPRTHFMRKVLHEIGETSALELDYDYTKEEVDYLIHRHMVETAEKYKQREAMFCQRQLAQTENELRRLKISSPVNAQSDNAEGDNADNDNDENSSAENDNVESDNMENENMEIDNVEDSFAESDLAQTENEPKRFKISSPVNAERYNKERGNADSDNNENSSAENDNMQTDNAEDSFAESDLAQTESEPKRFKISSPVNAKSDNEERDNADSNNGEDSFAENDNVESDNMENEYMETDNTEDSFAVSVLNESVNDDNYSADAEINDLSDRDDNDPTAGCLKRKMYSRQKEQNLKKERETRSDRLAYVSHRIHFSLRELFNARQFIRQAEENIKARGGENLIAMERARAVYCNPRRVATDAAITAGMAVSTGVNTKAAAEFDAEIHPPRYPDDSDFLDS